MCPDQTSNFQSSSQGFTWSQNFITDNILNPFVSLLSDNNIIDKVLTTGKRSNTLYPKYMIMASEDLLYSVTWIMRPCHWVLTAYILGGHFSL